MTIFAGVVATGERAPNSGFASAMLSYVMAPEHNKSEWFSDSQIDIAARGRNPDSDFYVDARWCVVACARLDEPEQLSEQLGLSTAGLNTGRLLATAYEKWGEALVSKIAGEFAFAIWDRKERVLFCGRDKFGQVPFAYLVGPDGVVFATDFLPIAMSQPLRPEVNESWIIHHINGSASEDDETPFTGIKRLPPASVMTWKNSGLSIRKYWSFSDIAGTSHDLSISDLSDELTEAIAKRMSPSDTVALLSGGLDSSSIAVLARDIRRNDVDELLPSVSLVFDDFPDESERPFIESVLEQGGFDPHFVNVQKYDFMAEVERFVEIQGAPNRAGAAPIFDQALEKVEQLGYSSVLDGHGGDEVISSFGIMRIFELGDDRQWFTAMQEMRALSRNSELDFFNNFVALYSLKGRSSLSQIVRKLYAKFAALTPKAAKPGLLRTEWETHSAVSSARQTAREAKPSNQKNEREFQERVLRDPLQSRNFELQHRHCRSRGIRPRIPFWDHHVIDYCVRSPSQQKMKNGMPRSLIRSVMGDRLPPMVANRTSKFDSGDAMVRSSQHSADGLRQFASASNHKVYDYVDADLFETAISSLHDLDRQSRRDAANSVWMVMSLLFWFDAIEKQTTLRKGPWEAP